MKIFDLVWGNEHPHMEALAFYLKHHFLYVMFKRLNRFKNIIGN
jgi:hypothetical protein